MALVSDWPDQPEEVAESGDRLAACEEALRTVLALAGELGRSVPPVDVELPADPVDASYALMALAPLGSLDRQALLGAAHRDRLERLVSLLTEQIETYRAELRLHPD